MSRLGVPGGYEMEQSRRYIDWVPRSTSPILENDSHRRMGLQLFDPVRNLSAWVFRRERDLVELGRLLRGGYARARGTGSPDETYGGHKNGPSTTGVVFCVMRRRKLWVTVCDLFFVIANFVGANQEW